MEAQPAKEGPSAALAFELIQALPQGVGVLDPQGFLLEANPRLLEMVRMPRELVLGRPLSQALAAWKAPAVEAAGWHAWLASALGAGAENDRAGTLILTRISGEDAAFRMTIRRIHTPGAPRLLLTLEEMTEAHKREQKILLLQKLGKHLVSTPDLRRLYFTILTCVTAGRALSFSRAFIYLPSDGGRRLSCKAAVGPGSQEEAWRIWTRLAQEDPDLDTLLARFSPDRVRDESERGFMELLRLPLDLDRPTGLVARAFREGVPMWTPNAAQDERESPDFVRLYKAQEYVAVPMIAAGRNLGVITADNLYRFQPIAASDIEFLAILADQAALALVNAFAQFTLQTKIKHLARINRSLSEARSKLILSEKMAAVGSVAARITHEIRNPLTTIGGFARKILRESEAGTRTQRNADIIVEEVVRLEKLLQGILDYSRPSSVRPASLELGAIVQNVLFTFSGRPETNAILVETRDRLQGARAYADPDHVRQILINLLKNAFEACGSQGRVRLNLERAGEQVALEVIDSGPGMEKEILQRLFEPFFTTKMSGTGLGLAITQALVQANAGRINVESSPGAGTLFRVLLPAAPQDGGRQSTGPAAE